jgi:Rhs element Vgr protein
MISEQVIPTSASPSVCTFTVLSDGTAVSGIYQVLSIIVQREVNRIPTATLIIRDGDPGSQEFEASDADLFIPGKRIEIKAGYQANEETIFQGMVVSHSLKVRQQASILTIVCKDEAFKMTVGRNSRYYRDQTDSDVLEDIIGQNGLQSEVEATTRQLPEVVQYDCTDWDFLMTRTEALGKICTVEAGKISISAPDFLQTPALTLQYGATLLEFDAEMDARTQFKSVKSAGWAAADQTLSEAEESTSGVPDAGNISPDDLASAHGTDPLTQRHTGNLPEAELQEWTKARLLRSRLAKVRGRAKFQGYAPILPGQLVKLQGVGARFEGIVFVSAIRHEVADGNWVTDAQIGLDPEWFAARYETAPPPAAALIPAIAGLHIGIVTQLENDPAGEHRIMVRLPLISPDDEGIWAKVATLDAGNNRGSFFRPEIDDEVIVGFLNGDPRYPVVLGACNSSAKPAPLEAKDDNHEKGFITRSGMKWLFDDDKKNMLLETPDGNKILVSGEDKAIQIEDQNGNKIILDADGITLESAKDIILKAAGDLKAEGINTEIKASASGEFSASATTTIKGGVVQIN